MAAWATVLLREASQTAPSDGLVRQAKELRKKILNTDTWTIANKDALKGILDLTATLDEHRLRDKDCLGYVIKIATRNAQEVEERVTAERKRDWKRFVAGTGGGFTKGV